MIARMSSLVSQTTWSHCYYNLPNGKFADGLVIAMLSQHEVNGDYQGVLLDSDFERDWDSWFVAKNVSVTQAQTELMRRVKQRNPEFDVRNVVGLSLPEIPDYDEVAG